MHILLVDDHPALQAGLRELLCAEFTGSQVECANTEEATLQKLEQGHWDLAVVDINFPGRGGLELIPTLKQARPMLKVLIYTMHSEQQFGLRAFRSGADGYLTKDSSPEELFLAVRQLVAGRKYLSSGLTEQLATAVREDFEGQKHEKLSAREYEVFRALVQNRSLSEIAGELDINIKTVSTYRSRIFEKLEIRNHGELLRYAMQHELLNH